MKKLIQGLFVALFAFSSITAATNKTFLMPRSHGVNLAMEYTTFNELIQNYDEDRFGTNLQATGFYSDSSNSSDLGKYFGVCKKNCFSFHSNWLADPAKGDVIGTYIVHDGGIPADPDEEYPNMRMPSLAGNLPTAFNGDGYPDGRELIQLKLAPDQTAYGLRIDYYQDLEKLWKGLYLKVALPIVHVKNNLNFGIANKYPTTQLEGAIGTSGTVFQKYFSGCLNVPANSVGPISGADLDTEDEKVNCSGSQTALCKAKMDCKSHSTTGVADIDVVLGYKFFERDKYYFGINLGLTIPTGDEPNGEWVFEPIVGNGSHWAFGAGLDTSVVLWDNNDDQNIRLTFVFNYRYMFKSSECRTLGLQLFDDDCWTQCATCDTSCCDPCATSCCTTDNCNTCMGVETRTDCCNTSCCDTSCCTDSCCDDCCSGCGCILNYGQYYLLNKAVEGTYINAQQFIPAANILTRKVDVKPKSQIDSILYFTYNNGSWTFDLGYNFFWKEREGVTLKDDPFCSADWGIVHPVMLTCINDATFDPTDADEARPNKKLTKCNIATSVAETPSQDTHKIFGSVGYIFKDWDYPLMMGFGGGYEFANSDAIENWQLWLKLGMAF